MDRWDEGYTYFYFYKIKRLNFNLAARLEYKVNLTDEDVLIPSMPCY